MSFGPTLSSRFLAFALLAACAFAAMFDPGGASVVQIVQAIDVGRFPLFEAVLAIPAALTWGDASISVLVLAALATLAAFVVLQLDHTSHAESMARRQWFSRHRGLVAV